MRAIVFAGGDPLDPCWHGAVANADLVVAADSGLGHARTLGIRADVVVGDMDSVDAETLERARFQGTRVERYSTLKDETDLELAIATARRLGADAATIVGAGGGRLDHFLANALLIAAPDWADLRIDALVGSARVAVVRDHVELQGAIGSLVTLLALHGPASGVTTRGLRWELTGDVLTPGSTRGVSNEMVEEIAIVMVEDGVLLAIQPNGGR
ncbi:MAG: thiamine diphosphokinase [Actinobacteria bacterium]|nr:thiamine diphosphokinase [Actinomycetota bacterium]